MHVTGHDGRGCGAYGDLLIFQRPQLSICFSYARFGVDSFVAESVKPLPPELQKGMANSIDKHFEQKM
jgi:hypothetical protein